jgi:hypothetical protein
MSEGDSAQQSGRRIPADVEITESRPNELHAFRATEGPVRPEADTS